MIASGVAYSRGAHWFYGLLIGGLFGPAGLLWIHIRTGRLCWHCCTKFHLKSRNCPHCHGDVIDRRKGKASRSGFGRRRSDHSMRTPTDLPQQGPEAAVQNAAG